MWLIYNLHYMHRWYHIAIHFRYKYIYMHFSPIFTLWVLWQLIAWRCALFTPGDVSAVFSSKYIETWVPRAWFLSFARWGHPCIDDVLRRLGVDGRAMRWYDRAKGQSLQAPHWFFLHFQPWILQGYFTLAFLIGVELMTLESWKDPLIKKIRHHNFCSDLLGVFSVWLYHMFMMNVT